MQEFIHSSDYEQRQHIRGERNTVVYKFGCKFSMHERCHKGLEPACREIFLKLLAKEVRSSNRLNHLWKCNLASPLVCHHGMKISGPVHSIFGQSKTLQENSALKRYSKICTAAPTPSRCRAWEFRVTLSEKRFSPTQHETLRPSLPYTT
jgi:hypothetical protein